MLGTIEFRRGPGVIEAEQCLSWVEFAVAFIQAAVRTGHHAGLSSFTNDVEGLKKFTQRGVVYKGRFMMEVFEGKSGSIKPTPLRQLTREELEIQEVKKKEDQKKKLMVKKMTKQMAALSTKT